MALRVLQQPRQRGGLTAALHHFIVTYEVAHVVAAERFVFLFDLSREFWQSGTACHILILQGK
jgi:hypothetical protein